MTEVVLWRVSKSRLVVAVEVALTDGRVRGHRDVPLANDLLAELAAYEYTTGTSGACTFGGVGAHDDLMAAVLVALWWGERREQGQGSAFLP